MKTDDVQRTDMPRLLPLALALTSVLGGCANMGNQRQDDGSSSGYQPLVMHADALHLQDAIPAGKATTASRQLAAEGIRALDARQYAKANDLFNLALKVDINNSQLHFLNALAYHLRGLGGEGKLYGLAQQGYERAIQFDGSNAVARHQLGLLYMDRREYTLAVGALMEASLYARNDADLLYDLAVASYYAKNPRTASAALEGLRQAEGAQLSQRTLRASAIVAACTGDDAGARQFLKQMRDAGASTAQVHFAEERVGTWRDSLQSGMMKAQFMQANPGGMGQPQGMAQQPGMGGMMQQPGMGGMMQQPGMGMQQQGMGGMMQQPGMMGMPGQMGGFFEKKMVMLDVAIVSTEEDNNDTFGINVLDGLRIQFGNTLGTPAVSRTSTANSDLINPLNDTKTQVMTRRIGATRW